MRNKAILDFVKLVDQRTRQALKWSHYSAGKAMLCVYGGGGWSTGCQGTPTRAGRGKQGFPEEVMLK